MCLYDDAIPDPLPKLGLRGPKLFSIRADDEGVSFLALQLFLLFVLRRHI